MRFSGGFCSGTKCAAAVVITLVLSACHSVQSRNVPVSGLSTVKQGVLAVDVQNQLGEVEVVVDAHEPAPRVEAIPLKRDVPISQVDRASAEKPWVAAQVSDDAGGNVLRVLCTAPENQTPAPVYLRIVVPDCQGVRVKNSGGPVTLTGVGGAIEVECTPSTPAMWDGGAAIHVSTRRAITSNVLLSSTDGEVVLVVGRSSTGKIEALSPDSEIKIAASEGIATNGLVATNVRGRYTSSFNGGDNPITLRSGKRIRFSTTTEPVPDAVKPADTAPAGAGGPTAESVPGSK